MELLELRYFVEVAAAGSFSRAAVRLGITQPALSRQVHKLERELGNGLFYRHGRGVTLTAAGSRLHDIVKPLLQQLVEIKDEIIEAGGEPSGTVVLGVPPSISATLAAPLSLRFHEACPGARLQVKEAFSSTLLEWLEAGRLDLAVLYDARRSRNLVVTPLLLEDLFLVEAAGSSAAGTVDLRQLAAKRLLLPGPENGLRRVIDMAVRRVGGRLDVGMELDSVAALRQLVEAGEGATILPFGAVHREVSEGRLTARPFDLAHMQAMLVTATPLHRPVASATRVLMRLIQAEVKRSVASGVLRGQTRKLKLSALQAMSTMLATIS